MKIAITGGIGSGKSTVARVARDMGFKVASCDDTYARLCRDADFLRELGTLFPAAVKGDPPALDRRALAEEVFSSDARRALLNDFTHPRIMAAMEKEIGGGTAFYEVPLLFESGLKGCFDEIIVVLRERNARMAAVAARSGLTEEQIKAETSRCLSCGASVVDPNKCIGCGICTTKCEFDAIHLHRELPECSTMRTSEEKLKYILSYGAKQAIKIKFSKKDK